MSYVKIKLIALVQRILLFFIRIFTCFAMQLKVKLHKLFYTI